MREQHIFKRVQRGAKCLRQARTPRILLIFNAPLHCTSYHVQLMSLTLNTAFVALVTLSSNNKFMLHQPEKIITRLQISP